MKGQVKAVEQRGDRMAATVTLENGADVEVAYWPELLEQWGPDALRAHLVQQAQQQQAAAAAAAAAHEPHAALLGEADAAPVCRKGEIGCTDDHAPVASEAEKPGV